MRPSLLGGVVLLALVAATVALVEPLPRTMARKAQKDFPAKIFQQRTDHFNPLDSRTFSQRYYENPTYYTPGGPAIIYINGEGPVTAPPFNASEDFVVTVAEAFKATIVTLEHRYYGLSVPTTDLSTPNLQWLTVAQALEDLATFITWYAETQLQDTQTQWITIGGSYSGALSAWFRLKYPHLTIGAVSSSGVVNAIYDFTAFDQQVAISAGTDCANILRNLTAQIQGMVFASPESNVAVKTMFQAQNILVEDGDFFYYIADKMAESVQYGYQLAMCDPLIKAASSNQALLPVFVDYVNSVAAPILGGPLGYNTAACLNTTISEDANYRQWWWQTCTELAYFQCAPAEGSIRSNQVNLTYHLNMCNTLFGLTSPPNVNATNVCYGGNETAGINIWFNDGSQDPWQRASVSQSPGPLEPYRLITCTTCGHCVDLRGCPDGCTDTNLYTVRDEVIFAIKAWLEFSRSNAK